jgi:hypothetical protein
MFTVSYPQIDRKTRDERTANAYLIAAAPDLLAACDGLLKLVANAIVHGMPVTKVVADIRNAACAAMNKAEGKS